MYLPEFHICCMCKMYLGTENGDGICFDCDLKCRNCSKYLPEDGTDIICEECSEESTGIYIND